MIQFGFFDYSDRLQSLSKCGDPLLKLDELIPWESFRKPLRKILKRSLKSTAGRPAFDMVLMFKILVLQNLYNLSDDQTEFQIRDRLSFMRFLGFSISDRVPDAKTIWSFKDHLSKKNAADALFAHFTSYLQQAGYLAMGGQIVDASIVSCPKQRNSKPENDTIKEGSVPEDWGNQPSKLRQKDVDARWTQKNGKNYYGYKNHICIDRTHKMIRKYTVTPSSTHDSQELERLVDLMNTAAVIWADSAYRSAKIETTLSDKLIRSQVHYKGARNKPLSKYKASLNKKRSSVRARVEHVFGAQSQMGGGFSRSIGAARNKLRVGLVNLTYNLRRYTYLESQIPNLSSA